MNNEKTSKRVARIAGKVLNRIKDLSIGGRDKVYSDCENLSGFCMHALCTVEELKALAASALTQTADKPRRRK